MTQFTTLGADMTARRNGTQSGAMSVMDQMMAEMEARCMERVDTLFAGIKFPDLTMPPVNVDAPVTVNVPESDNEAPVVNVAVPDNAELTKAMNALTVALYDVLTELRKPVTRTVKRGEGDLITSVTETR